MTENNIEHVFKEKYELYSGMLYKIAFSHLGNYHEVEDALQEVFTKLLYKAPKFKDDEHEKAWLIRITVNTCKDMLRSFFRRKTTNIDDLQIPAPETNRIILNEVIKLPAKYKTVIHLFYYEDYTVSQIAQILKMSSSAVKMRLHRGREILKMELEDSSYDEGIVQNSIHEY